MAETTQETEETWKSLEDTDEVFYSYSDGSYMAYYGHRGELHVACRIKKAEGEYMKRTSPMDIILLPKNKSDVLTGKQFKAGERPRLF